MLWYLFWRSCIWSQIKYINMHAYFAHLWLVLRIMSERTCLPGEDVFGLFVLSLSSWKKERAHFNGAVFFLLSAPYWFTQIKPSFILFFLSLVSSFSTLSALWINPCQSFIFSAFHSALQRPTVFLLCFSKLLYTHGHSSVFGKYPFYRVNITYIARNTIYIPPFDYIHKYAHQNILSLKMKAASSSETT